MTAKTLSGVRLILRNDTASNWTTNNPVLLKGEMGVESDTGLFKFGDGTHSWTGLSYSGTIVTSSTNNGKIKVNGSDVTVYTLPIATSSLGGVVTGGDISINSSTGVVSLATSGVSSGTYTKVTVDTKGRVTSGANLAASDITSLLGTAATKNTGTSSGNIPVLDSNGKLNTSVLPSLAIGTVKTVADNTTRNALTTSDVQQGDVVIVTGTSKTYIVTDDTKLDSNDGYTEILTPVSPVQSVNSKTGAVTLTTDDISEGSTNLYWTASRFNTAFAGKASTGLTDTADIMRYTDTVILDCGDSD